MKYVSGIGLEARGNYLDQFWSKFRFDYVRDPNLTFSWFPDFLFPGNLYLWLLIYQIISKHTRKYGHMLFLQIWQSASLEIVEICASFVVFPFSIFSCQFLVSLVISIIYSFFIFMVHVRFYCFPFIIFGSLIFIHFRKDGHREMMDIC